ncbi:baseplate j family protein [Leptolyngbya sp. Heron Island J]|nr:baseplate j family protein [Leptolyngbya sp. Heron Island J]
MGDKPVLPIDYTNLDYESLREAMLGLAQETLPEWTDLSENDLGVLLVELFAYACDITLYYQTRIANNLLPETADEPEALIQLLRLIGYELRPASPATVNLSAAVDAAVISDETSILIPNRTQFFVSLPTGEQVVFETVDEITIAPHQLSLPDVQNLRYFLPIPVVQGQSILDEAVAESDGSPNQSYSLEAGPVIADSIEVTVSEPGGETRWQAVDSLADSSPADRNFVVQWDAQGRATLRFGDNLNGMAPLRGTAISPVLIRATYRVGGGPQGNVAAGTVFTPASTLPGNISLLNVTNLAAAAGGQVGESLDRARRLAPRLYRTQERAVTPRDYADLALMVPGVGKAKAVATNWNQVVLYIAPAGQVATPTELLQQNVLAFFESRRPVTTALTVVGPQPADIYLRADIRAQPYYRQIDVQQAVEQAVADYLAFDTLEFGQRIYLSKVYEIIQSLPQVASLTVTQFSRQPNTGMGMDIESDGIIELSPNELPRLGYRDNPNTLAAPGNNSYRPAIALRIQGEVVA